MVFCFANHFSFKTILRAVLQIHQRNLNTKEVFFRKLYVAVWNIYHSCHSHLCLEPRSFQKKTAYSCQTTYLSVNKKVTFWGGVLGENLTCSQQKPNRNMLSFSVFFFFSQIQWNSSSKTLMLYLYKDVALKLDTV